MPSDEALYESLLAGDVRAFDQLYERHERPLFGFIRGYLADSAEAEDVLHDAFLALLRDREGARSTVSLRAWLFQVAMHLCLNRQRTRKRAGRALETEARSEPSASSGPEELLVGRERRVALRRAVERLPRELAALYQLRASGLAYQEMAEVLGVPLGTIKSRMHQMVKSLREELGNEL